MSQQELTIGTLRQVGYKLTLTCLDCSAPLDGLLMAPKHRNEPLGDLFSSRHFVCPKGTDHRVIILGTKPGRPELIAGALPQRQCLAEWPDTGVSVQVYGRCTFIGYEAGKQGKSQRSAYFDAKLRPDALSAIPEVRGIKEANVRRSFAKLLQEINRMTIYRTTGCHFESNLAGISSWVQFMFSNWTENTLSAIQHQALHIGKDMAGEDCPGSKADVIVDIIIYNLRPLYGISIDISADSSSSWLARMERVLSSVMSANRDTRPDLETGER